MMKRILIVDDEVSSRNALGTYLVRRGYEVVHAGSGEEVIRALHREKIACALLDIGLPDQSGIDLVPHLFEAVAAVGSRRQALVFIEDTAESADPAGIAGETLDGADTR